MSRERNSSRCGKWYERDVYKGCEKRDEVEIMVGFVVTKKTAVPLARNKRINSDCIIGRRIKGVLYIHRLDASQSG